MTAGAPRSRKRRRSIWRARVSAACSACWTTPATTPEGRRGAVDPRLIAQAIAQFRASARLSPNATEDQLIDALETAARRSSTGQVGLTLCNRTNARLWTAVGRRRGEGWESRGWWSLNPNSCVRTIDEVLMQERYYVYASMDTAEGPRLLRSGEIFCTSPSRFAVLGRDDCAARYYRESAFAPINTSGRQGLVVEFDEENFLEVGMQSRVVTHAPDGASPATREAPRRGL